MVSRAPVQRRSRAALWCSRIEFPTETEVSALSGNEQHRLDGTELAFLRDDPKFTANISIGYVRRRRTVLGAGVFLGGTVVRWQASLTPPLLTGVRPWQRSETLDRRYPATVDGGRECLIVAVVLVRYRRTKFIDRPVEPVLGPAASGNGHRVARACVRASIRRARRSTPTRKADMVSTIAEAAQHQFGYDAFSGVSDQVVQPARPWARDPQRALRLPSLSEQVPRALSARNGRYCFP